MEESLKNINFSCNIPQFNTIRLIQLNGKLYEDVELEEKYNDSVKIERTEDGISIQIKENTTIDVPLQIINVIGDNQELKTSSFSTVKLGQNSRLRLIHCDDSLSDQAYDLTNKLNIEIESGASLDYYKMENINDRSSISTEVCFEMGRESKLTTFGLSLNGKLIRNKIMVNFNDEYSVADLNGLYLMDKQQEAETEINVYHHKPNCSSNQLFKGILDDVAKSSFVGHVFVDYGAKGTVALQNNKNMLLTDKAKVNTRPFLEIYNDDVKCSHGATIGQLNADALFYLRTRCISERSARMLLMYAFCEDVLSKSDIEELKESLGDLIKKRLQGELTACGNCVFQCSTPKLKLN
ncbi:MAG: Fe-S cluster assembly protein SufD [Bacteroidales bacterium]|nr:Fe-S cluster assembly protein SufD [Bacteroidales bacterium]